MYYRVTLYNFFSSDQTKVKGAHSTSATILEYLCAETIFAAVTVF